MYKYVCPQPELPGVHFDLLFSNRPHYCALYSSIMTSNFRSLVSQWFPGKPTFANADILPLKGKVFIVTGGNTGC
jgi:hypothetical protein